MESSCSRVAQKGHEIDLQISSSEYHPNEKLGFCLITLQESPPVIRPTHVHRKSNKYVRISFINTHWLLRVLRHLRKTFKLKDRDQKKQIKAIQRKTETMLAVEENFQLIIINILKEIRENIASLKQELICNKMLWKQRTMRNQERTVGN